MNDFDTLTNAIGAQIKSALPDTSNESKILSEALTELDRIYGYEGRVNHPLTKAYTKGEINADNFHKKVFEMTTQKLSWFENVKVKVLAINPELIVELERDWIWVSGNTYECREELKALEFRWAGRRKAWYLKPETKKAKSATKKEKATSKAKPITSEKKKGVKLTKSQL